MEHKKFSIGDEVYFTPYIRRLRIGKIMDTRSSKGYIFTGKGEGLLDFLIKWEEKGESFMWWMNEETIICPSSSNTDVLNEKYNTNNKEIADEIKHLENCLKKIIRRLKNEKNELFANTVADMKNINMNSPVE